MKPLRLLAWSAVAFLALARFAAAGDAASDALPPTPPPRTAELGQPKEATPVRTDDDAAATDKAAAKPGDKAAAPDVAQPEMTPEEAVARGTIGAEHRAAQLVTRLYLVDDRLFAVTAIAADGELPPAALDVFLSSFRLTD